MGTARLTDLVAFPPAPIQDNVYLYCPPLVGVITSEPTVTLLPVSPSSPEQLVALVLDHDTVTAVPTGAFSDEIESTNVGAEAVAGEGIIIGIGVVSGDEEPPPQPLSANTPVDATIIKIVLFIYITIFFSL
jgi:hypothetical protein